MFAARLHTDDVVRESFCPGVVARMIDEEDNLTVVCKFVRARACPPEDVGGMPGYGDFLEAIRNTTHPEYNEVLD